MTTPDQPSAQPDSGERNVSAEAVQVQLGEGIAAHQQGDLARAQEAYEALAAEFAGDPARLAGIKEQLIVNRLTAPLFDTEPYARHLESSYMQMVDHYRSGLPPDHLEVAGLIQPGASGIEYRRE